MASLSAREILTARRLKGEIQNLEKDREPYYQVIQDSSDQFLFYFLIRGKEKQYDGGYYIGKIVLPHDYPATPGDFYMLTPSGRFQVNSKICLTNSSYHKENWTPIWNIKNMVIGFMSIFGSDKDTGISHIVESENQRICKARESVDYNRTHHSDIFNKFDQFIKEDGSLRTDDEIVEWINEKKQKKSKKSNKVVIEK